jgi:hypothetical protein
VAARVGGQSVEVVSERVGDELLVALGTAKVVIGSKGQDGQIPVTDDGSVSVETGGVISVRSEGFEPFSDVEGWLFSDPLLLGSVEANDAGRVVAEFAVPQVLELGAHRFVLRATDLSGNPLEMVLGVSVSAPNNGDTQWAVTLVVSVLVIGMVSALFMPAVVRRRRSS